MKLNIKQVPLEMLVWSWRVTCLRLERILTNLFLWRQGGGAGHATVWKLVTLLFEYQDPIDLSKEVLMLITTTSAGQFEALLAS